MGETSSGGLAGDSGAAGMSSSCVPVNDNNPCTDDVCLNGAPANPPTALGTACTSGGTKCDGNGACIACLAASDCPGVDDACETRTCTQGACGFQFASSGTLLPAQTAGDCRQARCDGNGAVMQSIDDSDIPNDSNACTNDACNSGSPSNLPLAAGTSCGTNLLCNSSAVCVGCIAAADCPGSNNECKTRTCTSGQCGVTFTASGTAVAAQTANNCLKATCDGAGNISNIADGTDVPADDGNACTDEACAQGVPQHPAKTNGASCSDGNACTSADTCQSGTCSSGAAVTCSALDQCHTAGTCNTTTGLCSNPTKAVGATCSQGGGSVCSSSATCVQCNMATDCPGSDTECHIRTCVSNLCGVTNTSAGSPTAAQAPGDCHQNQCDGAGNIVGVADNSDVPADDGNQCTDDTCSAGTPVHPPKANTATCNQGGSFCSGAGACVACNLAAQCPGTDTECHSRTCTSNTCGISNVGNGTVTSAQTAHDCHQNRCDGSGNITSAIDDTDVPSDDGNQCSDEICTAGVASHPAQPLNTPCSQGGGTFCSATAVCAPCNAPTQCPGVDTECQARSCSSNTCGIDFTAAGTPTAAQTVGDCQQNQCDGSGHITSAALNTDAPADDGNQCTNEVCTNGVTSHPKLAAGTTCNQGGGSVCDSSGTCTTPAVVSTTPSNGSTPAASPSISITFNVPMNPATLSAQTSAGACSGSIQASLDDFVTCIAFSAATAAMSGSNTVATLTAAPGLLVNRAYKIRVTAAAQSANGSALSAYAYAFTTTTPNLCDGSIVISQVFGGGGGLNPTYGNDFVELHNRGSVAVNVNGWAVQYASATGTTWQQTLLPNVSIQPGAFFLVAESGGSTGTFQPLPAADATGVIAMAQLAGKVAVTNTATPLTGSCASAPSVVDFVGYGATADCFEGASATPAPSLTTGAFRVQAGCADVNDNSADFLNSPLIPHNSSFSSACGCAVQNEAASAALEADYCGMAAAQPIIIAPNTPTAIIPAQLYEAGITDLSASANPSVRAQLGYGPTTANPEYEPSWTWSNATFNSSCSGCGNNHEYLGSFSSPSAVGSYNYTYRFSLDQGVTWTYCDVDGAGSNANLNFNFADEATLTVQ